MDSCPVHLNNEQRAALLPGAALIFPPPMARIRSVKPEFFKHFDLFQAEKKSGLPLRLGFQGLWIVADKEGRFKWLPQQLKLDILPYDEIDFEKVLEALVEHKFIGKYMASDGKHYGNIPSFPDHQRITGTEATSESKIPPPPSESNSYVNGNIVAILGNTLETTRTTGGERKGRELGKEREGSSQTDSMEFSIYDIEKFLKENRGQLETVCMNSGKSEIEVLRVLKKYHLACQEKEIYPKKPLPLIAGLQKWLLNENKFNNGKDSGHFGEKPVPSVQPTGSFRKL